MSFVSEHSENISVFVKEEGIPCLEEDFFLESSETEKTKIDMFLLKTFISLSKPEMFEEIILRGMNRGIDYLNISNDGINTFNPIHDGETLLMWIARSKNLGEKGAETVEILLKYGASSSKKNSAGFSAEEIAVLCENWVVVGAIMENK